MNEPHLTAISFSQPSDAALQTFLNVLTRRLKPKARVKVVQELAAIVAHLEDGSRALNVVPLRGRRLGLEERGALADRVAQADAIRHLILRAGLGPPALRRLP